MRSKSPEKRGRQKVVRAPTYRIENVYNPEAMPQYFQIAVNVLEARNLTWTKDHSGASYVIVILGKKKQRTRIRTNLEKPFKEENLFFELHVSPRDLQRSNLWFAVLEPKCSGPRLLGEASVCLGDIWIRPNHEVFQRWVQLTPSGFLKVDVKIILRGEVHVEHAIINDDKLEDNLISSGAEQQCTNYIITIYEGFGLASADSKNNKSSKKPLPRSTFVKASFCGLTAKTSNQPLSDNPAYCEQLSMVEMFPNINQIIYLEVWSNEGCFSRILGSVRLNLADISHHGENGFLPTFGPSLLHMYGTWNSGTTKMVSDNPYYCGTLLVACKVMVPYYKQNFRSVNVEPVIPISLENLWTFDDFCIYCPIFEVSMLNRSVAGKFCGLAITIGEMDIDNKSDKEFMLMSNDIISRKLHYTGCLEVLKNELEYGYLDFSNAFPVLQLAYRLPDFRFRMYINNMISGIATSLENALNAIESRLKSNDYSSPVELIEALYKTLDDAKGKVAKFLDIIQGPNIVSRSDNVMKQCMTELDQKRITLQKEEIEKIHKRILQKTKFSSTYTKDTIFGSRKMVKNFLADMRIIAQDMKELVYNSLGGWPDIIVWLLNNGSRVALSKISTADVIYSVLPEQSGKNCGRIQTIYMKPLKCSKHQNLYGDCCCIAGKVELLAWMGSYRQKPAFDSCIPGYVLKTKGYDMYMKGTTMMVECRVFIYKAKLKSESYGLNSIQTFLRIHALNTVKDTKIKCKTLTPVWNQVLKIQRMVFMTPERLANSPAIVLVEVYNKELSGKIELIGRFEVQPSVVETQDIMSTPKLQWYNMYKGAESSGQLLMSVQLTQIPEKLLKNIIYSPNVESYVTIDSKGIGGNEELITLPEHLFPATTTYKVDVYWWGLRNINIKRKLGVVLEIEDLSVRSDVITDKRSNSNFPNGRMSQIFDAPWSDAYSPMFNIRLFDSSTFGRTQYLDTNAVKNPNKYIVNWLAKDDRDTSLKCASVMSTEFIQVNRTLFIKKSSKTNKEWPSYDSNSTDRNMISKCRTKPTKWKSLFWQREVDEEEYTLLPMFYKVNKNKLVTKKDVFVPTLQRDWWLKYMLSKEHITDKELILNGDKLIIFDSELENQQQFSKFKDWCTTLKLYNGKKTGIPVKDEQTYCGLLKAGLAIYRWPPPDTKTAVTYSGIELNRGFFDDHPNNDYLNFFVRVYIVRGFNLKIKNFVRNTTPYVILTCGNKELGNRHDCLSSHTLNPIFGKIRDYYKNHYKFCMGPWNQTLYYTKESSKIGSQMSKSSCYRNSNYTKLIYELRCSLPEDYLLVINLYNNDGSSLDELIGSTTIDLENRIYSKHRARIGLPFEYSINDVLKWRDNMKPSAILEELCSKNHLPLPVFIDNNTLMLNGVEYKDNERGNSFTSSVERKENLCLSILHKWHTLPVCGYHLVPEHVETRTLYNPNQPGIEQGKLQLWVDIFPLDTGVYIPPHIDITPKKPEDYELRVIVYTVRDINQDIYKFGCQSSGIYVKAWIGFAELSQNTDVDFESNSGEGNFNWRMVFQFLYQPEVRELACKAETNLSYYDEIVRPILYVQLMDSDALPPNDCLGSLSLDLNALPGAGKGIDDCSLDIMNSSNKLDLFFVRSHRAWWPLVCNESCSKIPLVVGKIDLELNLLPQDAAILMPVGLGREPPFPLPKPAYRDESYGLDKIKIIYQDHKCLIILLILCLAISIIFLVLYFEVPTIILKYGSLKSLW